jgi:hypothetical protein
MLFTNHGKCGRRAKYKSRESEKKHNKFNYEHKQHGQHFSPEIPLRPTYLKINYNITADVIGNIAKPRSI